MKKVKVLTSVLLSVVLFVTSCSTKEETSGVELPTEYREIELSPADMVVAKIQKSFGNDFFSRVAGMELELGSKRNMMVSPLSASIALSMVANTVDEQTEVAVLNHLGQNDLALLNAYNSKLLSNLPIAGAKTKLALANSIWVTDRVNIPANYSTVFYEIFGDYPRSLNFTDKAKAEKILDNWSKEHTNGLIDKLDLPMLDKMEVFLANALYFASDWDDEFDKKDTKSANFYVPGATVEVDMMHKDFSDVPAIMIDDTRIVKLYFHDKRYALTLILPELGVSPLEIVSDPEKLDEIMNADFVSGSYLIEIPKFTVKSKFWMRDYLEIFLPEFIDGNWAKCGVTSRLCDYTLVQHTKLIVNEKGAEMAAVTNTELIGSNYRPLDGKFRADHPFAFMVTEEKTGSILLAGVINDPTDTGED